MNYTQTKSKLTLTSLLTMLAGASALSQPGEAAFELDPLTVLSTTRTVKSLSTLPQTVSQIDTESWQLQLGLSTDPIAALSQLVPSYSPSRQKMSGFGETFRGRSPLFLLDGIPQSNPLRDGSRDGHTIDAAMIDRIEVIHGASAVQGLGATGGIINYLTISPPDTDGMRNRIRVGALLSDELESEGTGYMTDLTSRYRSGGFGYAAGISYKWQPMAYDGEGRLIGIDNTQGDTMNSSSVNLFAKLQAALSDHQLVEFMVNDFTLEQDLEYVLVNGDPASGLPATSIKGDTPGKPTRNAVTSASLTYTHTRLLGGTVKANAFYQDFSATYGGGTFGVFQVDGVPVFDQSQNESQKQGLKLSWLGDRVTALDLGIVAGIDYIEDETSQVLVQTGRVWVPLTNYQGLAPYLQIERPIGKLVLSGGLRYEDAKLKVGDFTTLEAYGSQLVLGGSPGFDELLLNLGITWEVRPGWTVFASYSEGFGMPDVGRVLRGINQPGLSVDSFLNLQPILTENYEIGLRTTSENWSAGWSLFYSKSALGSRLSADADGIFSVNRERTETYGAEANLEYRLNDAHRIDARFALVEGKYDSNRDGSVDRRLDGTNIPPARLNLGWVARWSSTWQTRLQTATYFDRSVDALPGRDFSGYTTVDLLIQWQLPKGRLDLGFANLLDKQYITYYAQTNPSPADYFAGRGRTLQATYTLEF